MPSHAPSHPETLTWSGGLDGHVRMIEQTLLPTRHEILEVRGVPEMVDAIRRLAVRGAPAIGVAAGYGVVLGAAGAARAGADVAQAAEESIQALWVSRPTAVNLFWALDRMRAACAAAVAEGLGGESLAQRLLEEALAIHASDRETCRLIGEHGAELLEDGTCVLTHCNAGALATGGMGTALAPVYTAHAQGKRVSVYADETRPLLQGARITCWELQQAGVPVTLITDGMAARVMSEGRVQAVIVGSDRITRGGDVCNKIGTFQVALAARHHGVPFHVAAPLSTVDTELIEGRDIPIEERAPEEITCGLGRQTAPEGVQVYNPAFDVTPRDLVTSIITEVGVVHAPSQERMEEALQRGGRL
jgi:methylthioribose-1-phosphate isomerase